MGNRGQVTFPFQGHVVGGFLLAAEGQRQEEWGKKLQRQGGSPMTMAENQVITG
jgi:hypothetical protein